MMNNFEETIYINDLLDLYGNLLTKKQYDVMVDYYQNNFSLSEISENKNISRTAVSDALKKGRNKLEDYDNKMHLYDIFKQLKNDNKNNDVIDFIKEKIKNGI